MSGGPPPSGRLVRGRRGRSSHSHHRARLTAALVVAGVLLAASSAVAGNGTYVVRSGDSLWGIAQKEDTTPQQLARLNRLSLASPLPVGLRLRLRPAAPAARYLVRPGDTLTAIAQRFRTTVVGLARANGLKISGPLLVGTRLAVPLPAATGGATVWRGTYVAAPGDSLTLIAARYRTTVAELARRNKVDPGGTLLVGERLVVPGLTSTAPAAAPAGAAASALATTLSRAIDAAPMQGVLTAAVVADLGTGRVVFERNADALLAPASLEKLPLSLAAYASLGPSYRIATTVLATGARSGGVLTGDLVLKGYGDPTLDGAGLADLARQVRAAGITDVRGRVLGDASYFDARRDVAGWKPSFDGVESPPLSALIVDRAVLDGRLSWDPAAAAAVLFAHALAAAGVHVAGASGTGTAPAAATVVARIHSPTVASLVDGMAKASDNFVAEMLLKELGAYGVGQGTSAAGAQVVRAVLARDGLPPLGVVDGSGLSRLDTVSARSLALLLIRLHQTPGLVAALPIAGVDGTLAHRLVGTPLAGRVHAKSGTTDGSSGLAGFVDDRYAFVIVSNGSFVPQWTAHSLQDAFVLALDAAS